MGSSFSIWHAVLEANAFQKGVLLLMIIMSVFSLMIAVERYWRFRKMRKSTLDFLPAVTKSFKSGDLKGALEETRRHKDSHLARVLNGGLHEFINHEQQKEEFDLIASCSRALERTGAITSAELRRGLAVLATVGATAPFVGLLGTVFGVINSFTGMAASGSGGLGAISQGIAEALFMTGVGLGVAIPAVWLFNFFTNKIEYFEVEMSNSASELLDYFLKKLGKGSVAAAGGR